MDSVTGYEDYRQSIQNRYTQSQKISVFQGTASGQNQYMQRIAERYKKLTLHFPLTLQPYQGIRKLMEFYPADFGNPAHLSDQHRIYTGAEKRTVRLFSYHKKRAAATVPGKIFNCLFQHYCLSVTDFFILFCSVRFSVWLSFNDCCHTKYSRIPCCSI